MEGESVLSESVAGGRLTLVGGQPYLPQTADYSSATLYYSPCVSDKVSIFDGAQWARYQFTSGSLDQTGLGMSANWAANSQFDVFVTLKDGAPVLATGPAWFGESLATRGLIRRNGVYVNQSSMTCDISPSSSITVLANQGTWLGSINVGSTPGVLNAKFTLGQNRRCDVWNLYNQTDIVLGVGCPPPGMTGAVYWRPDNQYPNWKAFNNDINNSGYYFTGAPANVHVEYLQRAFVDSLNFGICAATAVICKDSISNSRGTWMSFSSDNTQKADGVSGQATFIDRDSIGSHRAIMGTANANSTDGVTMWGLVYLPNRQPEDTHVMWIRYKG